MEVIVNNENQTVTIPLDMYHDLLEVEKFLQALEEAGVDNWHGYEYALESVRK